VVTGRPSLDTPVRDILPAGITAVPTRNGREITVEQLARHTSGLPHSPQRLGLRAVWAVATRGEDLYADQHAAPAGLAEPDKAARDPGEARIRYSNFGAAVLGVALTQVYGKATYYEMVEELVLRPLGLTATTAEPGETLAEGHTFRRRPDRTGTWTGWPARAHCGPRPGTC
jgi:serine-type D-Ala-D-Ala carboxypeptidase/endopeptidase